MTIARRQDVRHLQCPGLAAARRDGAGKWLLALGGPGWRVAGLICENSEVLPASRNKTIIDQAGGS